MNYKKIFNDINNVKKTIESNLEKNLNLVKIPAPLFLNQDIKLNDMLNGVERPVTFEYGKQKQCAEIVHSLAKWKRVALKEYGFKLNEGIYTNMIAIRRDEQLDNTHSYYVDQWDWEKVINDKKRNINTLKEHANKVYKSIINTYYLFNKNSKIKYPDELYFITSQELEDLYPKLSPKQREDEISKKYKAVFIIGIGNKLNSGLEHDLRSPEYDDWNLNGDIILWFDKLNSAIELSSMGIRVDSKSLLDQLNLSKSKLNKKDLSKYQLDIIENNLPLTIGGGIGQSRVCMFILNCEHIGQVQQSIWDQKDIKKFNLLK